jgi:hypothetical protein
MDAEEPGVDAVTGAFLIGFGIGLVIGVFVGASE